MFQGGGVTFQDGEIQKYEKLYSLQIKFSFRGAYLGFLGYNLEMS